MRTRERFAAVAAAVAALGAAGAVPASAAPTVYVNCESGASHISCNAYASGSAPMSISWTQHGVHMAPWNDRWAILEWCLPNQVIQITATVTDATGSATSGDTVLCTTAPWP